MKFEFDPTHFRGYDGSALNSHVIIIIIIISIIIIINNLFKVDDKKNL